MPNTDTVKQMNGKPRELNQGGTSTSETAFTTDGTTVVLLPLPQAEEFGRSGSTGFSTAFRVRAWGRATGGTTTNFTAQVVYGTSVSSHTDFETTGAVAINSISSNWYIDTTCVVDQDSGKINGRGWTFLEGTLTAEAATTQQTSVDLDSNGTNGFLVTGTFSVGNASNKAYLDGFQIDKI